MRSSVKKPPLTPVRSISKTGASGMPTRPTPKRRGRGRPAPRRNNRNRAKPSVSRAPPLPVFENAEVTVVNGDRSSLTWKRGYKLLSTDERTGICTVMGSDKKTRQFPRAVVKPKNWISKLKEFFLVLGDKENGNAVDFYSFSAAMELLGAPYTDLQCMKIFQTLDMRAHGFLEFQSFLNWMYGLGRHPDRAKLLTTMECVCGARDWEQDRKLQEVENGKNLPFYAFQRKALTEKISQTEDQNAKAAWKLSNINWAQSDENEICLVPAGSYDSMSNGMSGGPAAAAAAAAAPAAAVGDMSPDVGGDEKKDVEDASRSDDKDELYKQIGNAAPAAAAGSEGVRVPRNLKQFTERFAQALQSKLDKFIPVFRPCFPNKENDIALVVMGPGETGKSAMLNRFVKGVFPHEYDPTITDNFRKSFVVDDDSCVLEITDTAGQEEFASMRYEWLRDGVDVLMVTFTRASKATFLQWKEQIKIAQRMLIDVAWHEERKEWYIQKRTVPIIAVATKADLYDEELEVTEDEVLDAIDELGGSKFIQYFECSAYLDDSDKTRVDIPFEEAVRAYRDARQGKKVAKLSREDSVMERRDSLAREYEKTRSEKIKVSMMNCIHACLSVCPSLQKYVHIEEPIDRRLLVIGRVPKDRFPDDLARPVFSVRHFMIQRHFNARKFFGGILMSLIFPFVLAIQQLVFVFYDERCGCNKLLLKLPEWDYNDPSVQILFDFLAPVVGRDPREEMLREDSRLWFVSQTLKQKILRLIISPFIIGLFFFAFYNAFQEYVSDANYKVYLDADYDNTSQTGKLSVMEFLGPVVLWMITWFMISLYMALDVDVEPKVPSLQELRPFVLYLGDEESIRTTAYVFLRGFAKSTLEMLKLEATWRRIVVALIISIVYCLIPGITRSVISEGFFTNTDDRTESVAALITNLLLTFVLALALQMQLLSGLQNYVEWMDDVTSLLDPDFAAKRDLPYLSMVRQSNAIAWIEMRTYLYTKGLIIFSRQEIFVTGMLTGTFLLSVYLLYRLLTDDDNIYESETVNGLFFMFLVLCYALVRLLRTVKMVERLQEKQEALLSNQKLKVYYRRITYHPTEREDGTANGNGKKAKGKGKQDTYDQLDSVTSVPFNDSDNESTDGISGIGIDSAKDFGAALADTLGNLMSTTGATSIFKSLTGEDNVENQEMMSGGIALLSVQNEEYLHNTETLLSDIRSLVHSQDIVPRVCNIELRKVIGLAVFAALFAVIPTTLRTLSQE